MVWDALNLRGIQISHLHICPIRLQPVPQTYTTDTTVDARVATNELICTSPAAMEMMTITSLATKDLTYASPAPFRDGWRSLSDELRVAILRHTLPSNENLCVTDFNRLLRSPTAERPLCA
jgi:hypothetical protein